MSDSVTEKTWDFEVSQDQIRFLKIAKCTWVGNSLKMTVPAEIAEIWGASKTDTEPFDILLYAMDVENQGEIVDALEPKGDPHIATIMSRKILHKADFFEKRSIDKGLSSKNRKVKG